MSKKQTLAEQFGYTDLLHLVEDYIFDGVMPGICMNKGCDYSTELEPDNDAGWCDNCQQNSMKAATVLLGII